MRTRAKSAATQGAGSEATATANTLVTLVFIDLVNSTALKAALPGPDVTARNRAYFETMHTGAPLTEAREAGDCIGHEVDYAKRVSAMASGGQILLSESAAVLVRDARIAGLALHAHRERELKGIGRVPLFELLRGEKRPQPLEPASSVLPLATAAAGELPAAALLDARGRSRIVGRDAEMRELKRRVDAARRGSGAESHRDVRLEARGPGGHGVIGRGRLRGATFHLRLERTGERFVALCSTDGEHWLTCGHADFPVKDPLQMGVWAAFGMVIHFDYVQLLGRE